MRIIMIWVLMISIQGCIKDDYLREKSRFGGPMMNDAERYKCHMDSLRPGCGYVVPRQYVY